MAKGTELSGIFQKEHIPVMYNQIFKSFLLWEFSLSIQFHFYYYFFHVSETHNFRILKTLPSVPKNDLPSFRNFRIFCFKWKFIWIADEFYINIHLFVFLALYTRTEQANDRRSIERFSLVFIGLGKEICPVSVYAVMVDAFGSSLNKRERRCCLKKTLPCLTMAASTTWTLNI